MTPELVAKLLTLPFLGGSEHFAFYGAIRNPLPGSAPSPSLPHVMHGTRDLELWKRYAATLEQIYSRLVEAKRPEPIFRYSRNPDRRQNRIPVFLLAADHGSPDCSAPFAWGGFFPSEEWAPFIGLPVRRSDPSRETERAYFEAVAVHELSHVFDMKLLPHRRTQTEYPPPEIGTWVWLAEGVATATESKILPENHDWLRYAMPWLDNPELSLTDPNAWYQAAFFVRYLERRIVACSGVSDFSYRVWEKSRSVWESVDGRAPRSLTALDALANALAEHGLEFCSSDPATDDLFASGFCMDSYFLWDSLSAGFEKAVHERFPGGRGITQSWHHLGRPLVANGGYELPHLACRYFRFYPTETPARISISIAVEQSRGCDLKAELACVVPGTMARGWKRSFTRMRNSGGYRLDLEHAARLSREDCDHLVLVVVNCALDTGSKPMPTASRFSVTAEWQPCE